MEQEKPIILVNYGLASSYDRFIEINHKLYSDANKILKDKIIKHERSHRNGAYSKKDIITDFQSKDSYFFKSLKFCLTSPEAWIGFFPLMYSYYGKDWSWNNSSAIPFAYFGLIFSIFFTVLFHVNFFKALLGYTVIFTLLNIILLLITHLEVRKWKDFKYKQVN